MKYKLIEHDYGETFIISESDNKEELYDIKEYYDRLQEITQNNVWYSIEELEK